MYVYVNHMAKESSEFQLIRSSSEPLHIQISDYLRRKIESGMWPAGFKLEAEEDLSRAFAVARGTVRKALRSLIEDGLIEQVHGHGTFVSSSMRAPSPTAQIGSLISSGEQMLQLGIPFTTELVDRRVETAGPATGAFAGGRVLKLVRRRLLLDGPDSVIETDLSLEAAPNAEHLEQRELIEGSLHATIRDRCGLSFAWAERVFSAEPAPSSIAELLEVSEGTPLLSYEQFSYTTDNRCVEYSRAWTRTDRHRHAVTIRETL